MKNAFLVFTILLAIGRSPAAEPPWYDDRKDLLGKFDTIRREVDRFLKDRGVHVNVVLHFDNIQTIKEALASGTGLSILPARTMQAEIEQFRLVALPLRAPELVRPLGLVHHKRRKLNRATQQLLELLLPQPEPVAELAMNEL